MAAIAPITGQFVPLATDLETALAIELPSRAHIALPV